MTNLQHIHFLITKRRNEDAVTEKITALFCVIIMDILFLELLFRFPPSGPGNDGRLSGSVGYQHIPHREQSVYVMNKAHGERS